MSDPGLPTELWKFKVTRGMRYDYPLISVEVEVAGSILSRFAFGISHETAERVRGGHPDPAAILVQKFQAMRGFVMGETDSTTLEYSKHDQAFRIGPIGHQSEVLYLKEDGSISIGHHHGVQILIPKEKSIQFLKDMCQALGTIPPAM